MHLDSIFSQQIEVSDNPYKIITEEIFKQDGQVKKIRKQDIYTLLSYSNLDTDIISRIIKNCEIKELRYPKNFIQRFYKNNDIKNLFINPQDFILSNKNNLDLFKHENKVEIDSNYIIITDRGQRILIDRKNKLYYFDVEGFEVYKII